MFGVTICLEFDASSQEALMGAKYLYEKKDKILTIVISELTIEERNLVLDIIRQIHEQGELIWRGTKKETLAAYKLYSANNKNKDTLDFFEKILDKDDYSALKMAYFIKNEMQTGHKVFEYKKDIRDRFGERGANIANLCSAGYFEEEFKPLYEASKEDFNGYYELAVGKKARALFIHSGMGYNEINEQFSRMVDKALRYHMKDFRVHALGEQNVTVLKKFFADRKPTEGDRFVIKKRYDTELPTYSTEYIITVQEY